MNGQHLVHHESEVPEDQQNLHKGSDVQHDGERHHQNVQERERRHQEISAAICPDFFREN